MGEHSISSVDLSQETDRGSADGATPSLGVAVEARRSGGATSENDDGDGSSHSSGRRCIAFSDVRNVTELRQYLDEGGLIDAVPFPIPYYPDEVQWTLLHWACYYNSLESIQLLLDRGANRLRKNSDGRLAIDIAKAQQAEAIKALKQEPPSAELVKRHQDILALLSSSP